MNALKDSKNSLLNRREVKVLVTQSGNPGIAKAQELIMQQFKADKDHVVVKTIKSKFGRDSFLIDAFIYDSVEHKTRVEPKVKVKKAAGETK